MSPPAPRQVLWLVAALVLVAAPHALRVPLWVSLFFVLLCAWRLLLSWRPQPPVRSWLMTLARQLTALGVFVGVYLSFGGRLGRDAGVALLLALIALKLMELKTERDYYVACFLGFFLVITQFFYSQTIPSALYMLGAVLLITACLIALNEGPRGLPWPRRLSLAGSLLLQALPLMLLAFLLFPRVSGPLWGLPRDAYSGMTGLSGEMSPGSLSQIGQSEAVAFRVSFHGPAPPLAQMYWRGPVLWETDGRTWSSSGSRWMPLVPVLAEGDPYDYTLTLEPHNQRWLFILEMPDQAPEIGLPTRDLQLLARSPVRQRLRYSLRAYGLYRVADADPVELSRALELPTGYHPRALALARQWRAEDPNPERLVRRALSLFNEQPFYYTLTPPLVPGDSVDGFLFETRRGFCEHYAAAFAVLMRGAGLPTRVVTGYQGGEYNPVGEYWVVRQRDAHAWAEVWLEGRGWTRVDPTAAVSPARIQRGAAELNPGAIAGVPVGLQTSPLIRDLWRQLRDSWDAVNNGWNQWVLGYGPQRQLQLMSQLGMGRVDWRRLSLWLLAGIGAFLAGLALWLHRRRPGTADPARAAYDRFCRRLARAGLRRAPSEGPVDFARRAAAGHREWAPAIDAITGAYVRLRYGPPGGDLADLQRRVRRFRPGR